MILKNRILFVQKKIILFMVAVIVIITLGFFVLVSQGSLTNDSAAKPVNLYYAQADKVCSMLKQSVALYQTNKLTQAHALAEGAYWDVYDNILEIKYRPYVSPGDLFGVEEQFHQFSNLILQTDSNVQQVNKSMQTLCDEVNKQAKFLTEKH